LAIALMMLESKQTTAGVERVGWAELEVMNQTMKEKLHAHYHRQNGDHHCSGRRRGVGLKRLRPVPYAPGDAEDRKQKPGHQIEGHRGEVADEILKPHAT